MPALFLWLMASSCGGGAVAEAPAPRVALAQAEARAVSVTLPFTGTVEPSRSLDLVALEDGRVTEIAVADGALVHAGETILRLGGARARATTRTLRAELEAAGTQAESARADLARAERRAQSQLAAPGELSAAQSAMARAEAELSRARAALRREDEALDLRAPWDGVFTGRRVSVGQSVSAGTSLGTLVDTASSRVRARVLPDSRRQPQTGQRAWLSDAPEDELRVAELLPVRDAGVSVWVEGASLATLAPGTPVRGEIQVAMHPAAVTVPPEAVVWDRDERPLVFVGLAPPYQPRPVQLGVRDPAWVEVSQGLEAGESVVAQGAYELYWASFAHDYVEPD